MSDRFADAATAQQAELAIARLDCISCLPSSALHFFSLLDKSQLSAAELAQIIQIEPAYAVKAMSLLWHNGIDLPGMDFSLERALDKLPPRAIRDAFLSAKVYQPARQQTERLVLRAGMVESAVAVACCAKELAELMGRDVNPDLAYWSGLLHNIGNLALDEAMPRSFDKLLDEAKSQGLALSAVQQKCLGADFTIFGKRLAAKWHIPDQIAEIIWLHRIDTRILAEALPQAAGAIIVGLAGKIVRRCAIGAQINFEPAPSLGDLSLPGPLTVEQVERTADNLAEKVRQKATQILADQTEALAGCWQAAGRVAARMAEENSKLSAESRRLISAASHLEFVTDFLQSLGPADSLLQIAENFAGRWQKFYQTGPVFISLPAPGNPQAATGVIIDLKGQARTVFVTIPPGKSAIPAEITHEFAVVPAGPHIAWLFEQAGADFDLTKTKILPLPAGNRLVGVLAFEQRMPGKLDLIEQELQAAVGCAGMVLDMAGQRTRQERLAERFAAALTTGDIAPAAAEQTPQASEPLDSDLIPALAEMAAGAAHELNNPLAVISGRAQLLVDIETDPGKKRMLNQIQENSQKITQIVDDLMSFAEPPPPRPAVWPVRQVIDEAVQLAAIKKQAEHLNIQTDITDGAGQVYVDSAQIVSAVANILVNAVESYDDPLGPVKVSALDQPGTMVRLQISDLGRGMDSQTIQKTIHPFFSSMPAGRKRGMGLAHAGRLIHLNGGRLDIESQPGQGTTVTVSLPRQAPDKA